MRHWSTIPSYIGNNYSAYTKRFYHGASGELLDAFVSGGMDLGDVPVQGKAGRHTLYWGESLFLGGRTAQHFLRARPAGPAEGLRHARYRSQGTVPSAEPAFRAGPGDRHAVGAPVSTCWSGNPRATLEGGTYLGPVDFVVQAARLPSSSARRLGFASRGAPSEPEAVRRVRPVRALVPRNAGRHRRLLLSPIRRQAAANADQRRPVPASHVTTSSTRTTSTCSCRAWPRTSAVSAWVRDSRRATTRRSTARPWALHRGLGDQGDTKGPRSASLTNFAEVAAQSGLDSARF